MHSLEPEHAMHIVKLCVCVHVSWVGLEWQDVFCKSIKSGDSPHDTCSRMQERITCS